MSEQFEQMTVLELRKAAKEMGVKLSAGISKQGIVERLAAAAAASEEEPLEETAQTDMEDIVKKPEQAPEAPAPVRHASIIVDDDMDEDDGMPPMGMRRAASERPVIPPRTTGLGGGSSLNTISAKAPAFTMEGSRAWHNPRTYTGPSAPRTAPAPGAWNSRPMVNEPRAYRPVTASRVPGTVPGRPNYPQRFGPEQTEPAPDYRAPYGAAGTQEYRNYQQPVRPQGAYPRRENGEVPQTTMNELLMTGECGDASGMLEVQAEGYGFLRSENPAEKDVYISAAQIRRFSLRSGDQVTGKTRPQRESDRTVAMLYITEINGQNPEEAAKRVPFESLTALYPAKRVRLTARGHQDPFLRLTELLCPVGFGQRALITVPEGCDADAVLIKMANAAAAFNSKAQVMALLLDEKPEDAVELKERLQAEAIVCTADRSMDAMARTAETTLERAKRLAEQKTDVVLFVNDISRLCDACCQLMPLAARVLPSGLTVGGMNRPRRFFCAARNTKEGGSLTVIAFRRERTDDPAEAAAAKELKALANWEMTLLPGVGAVSPLFDIRSCRSIRGEALLAEAEAQAVGKLRGEMRKMNDLSNDGALAYLAEMTEKTENNEALVTLLNTLY